VGVALDDVAMVIGDTQLAPYGGGNWGSRGTGIAGEATWQAGRALREAILSAARVLLECEASQLDVRAGVVVDAVSGQARLPLAELAQAVYFRPDRFPKEVQLANGTLAEYLVPMSAELPDIEVRHVSTPTESSALGAKGAGEAGVTGAPAAILNAINDALAPLAAAVYRIPATPEVILNALRSVRPSEG
jgi:CO/xanthine dehydrogenase Mo-binding subunit